MTDKRKLSLCLVVIFTLNIFIISMVQLATADSYKRVPAARW